MRLAFILSCALAQVAIAAPKVLICYGEPDDTVATALKTGLDGTGALGQVDLVDCSSSTPDLTKLKTYDAVLTWSNNNYLDSATLGDRLADYVDSGGGVVQTMFAMYSGYELLGRWSSDGYSCILTDDYEGGPPGLASQPNEKGSPLIVGVSTLSTSYVGIGALAKGAVSVWDYSNKMAAVARCAPKGHLRVDLNLYPNPNGDVNGDYLPLLKNALLYVGNGLNPLHGSPNPAPLPKTAVGAISNTMTIIYTNTDKAAQTVTGVAIAGTHAGDFALVAPPQFPLVVQPKGTVAIGVLFQPQTIGMRTASLTLAVDKQMSNADVALLGTAVAAQIIVTPWPLQFGGSLVNQSITKDLKIDNQSGDKVNITGVVLTGSDAFTIANSPSFPLLLSSQSNFSLGLTFKPIKDGIAKATLTVSTSDPITPSLTVPLQGFAGPPGILLDAGTVAFGGANLGEALVQPVTISNCDAAGCGAGTTGFSDLLVTDLSLSGNPDGDFLLNKMALPGTIPAQGSTKFSVTFQPTKLGLRTATVTISSSAGTRTVALQGTGTQAMLVAAPLSIDFGTVALKQGAAVQNITLTNSAGSGTVKVTAFNFSEASFTMASAPALPFSLGPGEQRVLGIACQPTKLGSLLGNLMVTSNGGSASVALTAKGVAPKVAVAPNPIVFKEVVLGATSQPLELTIANTGTDDLHVTGFNFDDAYADAADFIAVDLPKLPLVVVPGSQVTVHLVFAPKKSATELALLLLMTDDPKSPNIMVPLSGTGVQAGLSVMPQPVDFGLVLVGMASALPVTIKNTGGTALHLSGAVLAGEAAAQYATDATIPLVLDKGQQTTVHITLAPTHLGNELATWTLISQELAPVVVTLKGLGVGPQLMVKPMESDFGMVPIGTTSDPLLVGILNSGSQVLTIASITSDSTAFSVDSTATNLMLAKGATTTLAITYLPTALGADSGHVKITLKDSALTATISLTGRGLLPAPRTEGGCTVSQRGGTPLWGMLGLIALGLRRRSLRRGLLALFVLGSVAQASPKILICAEDDGDGSGAEIQAKLQATGSFSVVDLVDCGASTPTLAKLKGYDGVLAFNYVGFADPSTLGDHLADYVDGGGGVVNMMFAVDQWDALAGRWQSEEYDCITPAGALFTSSALKPQANAPQSSVVQGVVGLSTSERAGGALNAKRGAISLWDYQDGKVGVCQMTVGQAVRVDLNYYPNKVYYKESQPGDGMKLIANALLTVTNGLSPLKAAPSLVTFVDTGVGGSSAAQTVTFTNSAVAAKKVNQLLIAGVNGGDFAIVKAPQLPLMVDAQKTFTVEVVFQPSKSGSRIASLLAGVSGFPGLASVDLVGTGLSSQVVATPTALDVGPTQLGIAITKDLTISNLGGATVTVTGASVTSGQADYSLLGLPALPIALGPSASFKVTVQYKPQKGGTSVGKLTLTTNDPNTPSFDVVLSGCAGPAKINLDSLTLLFGSVNVGATASQTLLLSNAGCADLSVTGLKITGAADYSLEPINPPLVVTRKQNQPLVVLFKPKAAAQNLAGTLTVSSDDANTPTQNVSLIGSATSSILDTTPSKLSFGDVQVKMPSAQQEVTVANFGTGLLKVMGVTFDVAGYGLKGQLPPLSVSGGNSTKLAVVCTPSTLGALPGKMAIVTDIATHLVDLSCNGVAPKIAVSPNPIDLGTTLVGLASAKVPVTLSNSGSYDLHITALALGGADQNDFSSPNAPSMLTLKPAEMKTFDLVFTASRSAKELAEIDITSDDPMVPNLAVPITGLGVQQSFTVTPPVVDCGTVVVGTSSKPAVVTITNTGNVALPVKSVALGGTGAALFGIDMEGPITIDVGKSAMANVTFRPIAMAAGQAVLTVKADAIAPVTVQIKGVGILPTLGSVMPMALDFGMVGVGITSESQTVTLKNGADALDIASIVSSEADFVLDLAKTTLNLDPNATTTFAVSYRPSVGVAIHGVISLTVKGANRPAIQIAVAGTGVTAPAGCSVGRRAGSLAPLLALLLLVVLRRVARG